MDDILLAHPNYDGLQTCFKDLKFHLAKFGVVVAQEKIQLQYPYSYLGFQLFPQDICSLKIKIRTEDLYTLNDFQKLLGDINWLRPYSKLSTGQLWPLFDILKGDSDPLSVRTLTTEAKPALELVNQAIQNQRVKYVNYDLPIILIICKTEILPTGLL